MKKKGKIKSILKWVVVAIIVVGVLGTVFGGSKDDNKGSQTSQNQKEEVKTYGVGDTIVVGDVEYTVNSVNSSKKVGTQYLSTEAQETFLVINITIKNNGNESLSVSDSFFKLKKGDKEYDTSTDGNVYLENGLLYESVNPDAKLTGDICFDITQETIDDSSLQLQVQTGYWGTEKGLINLH